MLRIFRHVKAGAAYVGTVFVHFSWSTGKHAAVGEGWWGKFVSGGVRDA